MSMSDNFKTLIASPSFETVAPWPLEEQIQRRPVLETLSCLKVYFEHPGGLTSTNIAYLAC